MYPPTAAQLPSCPAAQGYQITMVRVVLVVLPLVILLGDPIMKIGVPATWMANSDSLARSAVVRLTHRADLRFSCCILCVVPLVSITFADTCIDASLPPRDLSVRLQLIEGRQHTPSWYTTHVQQPAELHVPTRLPLPRNILVSVQNHRCTRTVLRCFTRFYLMGKQSVAVAENVAHQLSRPPSNCQRSTYPYIYAYKVHPYTNPQSAARATCTLLLCT